MERVVIGKTGLEVNRLGFGGIPIQRVDESEAVEVVLHAVEKGVDFIDTARAYTTSERLIGLALQQTDKRVVLATKSRAGTSEEILADLETSLTDLQTDYIDLYQCHFVKDKAAYDQVTGPGGALEGLIKAKEQGLIGHIGLTSHSLDVLDRAIGEGLFETVMVCFSFLEPKAREKVIPRALENRIGVIAMKPFSGGVIDNSTLALKYALSQPEIVVIPGVESKELFDMNWEVFQAGCELEASEKKEIEEIRSRFDKAFCRRCDYCQPCSEEIPIQLILGLPSLVKRMGDSFLKREWALEAVGKARNCSECGECMDRCPYELPIPELIGKNLQWFDERMKT